MNEPKRRGRPPKAKDDGKAGITFDAGDTEATPYWSEATTPSGIVVMKQHTDAERAQAYALRVWKGQSVSVPYGERRWRVQKALEAQGMSMEGVVLPEQV